MLKPILITICFLFISYCSSSQGLVAVIDNALVALNGCEGDGEEICKIKTPYPPNRMYQLAFNQRDRLFYSILDGSVQPKLVAFDSTGQFFEIGAFTDGGQQIGLVESIAFNNLDGSILIGGSQNGPSSGDYFSETIYKVNPKTAECVRMFDISYEGIPNPDLDGMDVYNGFLYSFDGLPQDDKCRIYRFDLTQSPNVPEAKVWAERQEYIVQGYDLAIDCETIVYCHSRGKKSFVSMRTPYLWEDVGVSHNPDEHNGDIVHGLVRMGPVNKFVLNISRDTVVCASTNLELQVEPKDFCNVLWSTGEMGSSISVANSGVYFAKVTDGGCLTYTDSIKIDYTNNQISLAKYRNRVLCKGDSLVVYPSGNYESLIWSDGSQKDSLVIKSPGFYSVTGQWNGCEFKSENIYVDAVNEILKIEQQDTIICPGTTLTLTVDHSFIQSPLWNNGMTGNSVMVKEEGVYRASVLEKGCLVTSNEVSVKFAESEVYMNGSDQLCKDSFIVLSITAPVDSRITWNNGSSAPSIKISKPGPYFAEVVDGECSYVTDTFWVNESKDYIRLNQDDTSICNGTAFSITLEYSANPSSLVWSDGSSSNKLLISRPGIYWAQAVINGCLFRTIPVEVFLEDCPDCTVIFPNVFSPNGDGVNDEFTLLYDRSICQIEKSYMYIYDRWGAVVFEGPTDTWNGKENGRSLNPETFTYIFVGIGVSKKGNFQIKQFGDVTLLR